MLQTETQPWLEFYAWNTDGSPKNDLVFNTTGITLLYQRDNLADSAALTLSAASGPTDWAAGKFLARGGNKYRVGIPTAAISSFTGKASLSGSYTGGVLVGTTEAVLPPVPTAAEISADVSDQISQDFAEGDYSWPSVLTGIGLECRYGIENGTGVPLKDDAITAAKITAGALNGKGNWNIGKTGYALTSTEKTSIASSVWASTTRVLTAFGFTVATDGPSRTASQADVSSLATTAQLNAAQSSIEAVCATADVFGLATSAELTVAQDSIENELAKMPRAPVPIAAGAFVMTITGGQDAEVTYSEPI